jgi:putative inorganic carbon (HCO3(-)) transporter
LLMSQPPNLRPSRPVLIRISLLFVAMLIQLPFAADPLLAQEVFIDRVIKAAFLTFFMTVLLQSPRYLRYFLYAFLFSCFYITQESTRGLISGGLVWQSQGVMRLHGAVPIYRHPNSLGGLAMGGIPFVVFLWPVFRRWYLRIGLLALLGTSLTCVIYTASRTAYVAFIAFLLWCFYFSRNKLRWALYAVLIGAFVLLVVPQQYKERFLSIGGEEAEGHSKEARIQTLKDALVIFLENPAGVGVASFPAVRIQRFGRYKDTHNLYLEVATNLGVQGLIIFSALIYVMLKSFRRAYLRLQRQQRELAACLVRPQLPGSLRGTLRRHDRDLELLMATCQAGASFIFVRLMLGLFGMDLYEIYWWFGSGLAICLHNMSYATAAINRRLLEVCQGAP